MTPSAPALPPRARRNTCPRSWAVIILLVLGALAVPLHADAGARVGVGVGVNVGGPGYRGFVGYGYGRPAYWGPYRHGYWGGYYGYRPAYWGGWGWGPYWGPGPYYWGGAWAPVYPSVGVVTVPVSPPVYVERQQPEADRSASSSSAGSLEPGFWYYCRNPQGYYPDVADCPGGWVKVPPRADGAQ